jgi:hypothetical protein
MNAPKRIPWSVRIVAYLFALGGIGSLATLILETIRSDVNVMNLLWYLLQLEIAYGLLRLSRFWRFAALAWLAVSVASFVAVVIVGVFTAPPIVTATIKLGAGLSEQILYQIPLPKFVSVAIGLCLTFLINGWQWWALDRPEVRKLFMPQKHILQVQHS